MGMQGDGQMTLASEGNNRWKYTLTIRSNVANLSQTTVFEDHNGQWRPLSSTDSSLVLVKKVNKHRDLRLEQGRGALERRRQSRTCRPGELQTGDLDAHAGEPGHRARCRRRQAAELPHGRRRPRQDDELPGGRQGTITVGGKSRQATKVVRTDGDKQTIAWVVDGLPVPARILQRKNGQDEMDLSCSH